MAALPLVPFMAGAAVGAVASSLLGGGGKGGGSQPAPSTPTQPGGSPMPSLLPPSASSAGGTQAGAGVDEANPVDAKKASMQAQARRRGRRSTILTGGAPDEDSEYLGGM